MVPAADRRARAAPESEGAVPQPDASADQLKWCGHKLSTMPTHSRRDVRNVIGMELDLVEEVDYQVTLGMMYL